jgi:hypothetical protein
MFVDIGFEQSIGPAESREGDRDTGKKGGYSLAVLSRVSAFDATESRNRTGP